jgi:hypothetical protein
VSVTLPSWLVYGGFAAVIGLVLWFFTRSLAGDVGMLRRRARAYGVVLGSHGLARVATFQRALAGATAVAVPVVFLAATAMGEPGTAIIAAQAVGICWAAGLAIHAGRRTAIGERVAFARPSPLRDVCHPAVPWLLVAHAATMVACASWVWRSHGTEGRASVVLVAVVATAVVTDAGGLAGAAWLWRRPWRARDADDLAAAVVLRAETTMRLVLLPMLVSVVVWLAAVDAFERGSGSIPPVGMGLALLGVLFAPMVPATVLAARHAKGLGPRLGLAWPAPEPVVTVPGAATPS